MFSIPVLSIAQNRATIFSLKLLCMIYAVVALYPGHVEAQSSPAKSFAWAAPLTNADGSTPVDLAGYEISYGVASQSYSANQNVGNVLSSSVTFPKFNTGYFVAVRAYDAAGNKSVYSNEVKVVVSNCDLNSDGLTSVTDVQRIVNEAIGVALCSADINGDGSCDVRDVQRVSNAAMGGGC